MMLPSFSSLRGSLVLCLITLARAIPNNKAICSSKVTISTPLATITCVEVEVTTTTSALVVNLPGPTITTTSFTTIYSPTAVTCLSSATTFTATPSPLLKGREAQNKDQAAVIDSTKVKKDKQAKFLPNILCPTGIPNIPITPPCVTAIDPITTVTSTITDVVTIPEISFYQQPTSTKTVFQTYVQPTPSIYPGMKYYQYTNDYNYYPGPVQPLGFGGGNYQTSDWRENLNYESSGYISNLYLSTPDYPKGGNNCQLPGQPTATDCQQWTVVYQGFLFAPTTGDYVAKIMPTSDNGYLGWGGQKAYDGFTNDNVDFLDILVKEDSNKTITTTYRLNAGEFFPLTLIFANGGGPARMQTEFKFPDGKNYPEDIVDVFVPPCDGGAFVP